MKVPELVVYPILWVYVLIQCIRGYKTVIDNRFYPAIRKFNPEINLISHALTIVCFFASSLIAMFPDGVTLKVNILVIFVIIGAIAGSLSFAFFKYYVQFFITEQKLDLAQRMTMADESHPMVPSSLKFYGEKFLRSWTSSDRNYVITVVIFMILFVLPHIAVVFADNQGYYDHYVTDREFGEHADAWTLISSLVTLLQAIAISSVIGVLFFKMKSRRKDNDISTMMGLILLGSLHVGIWTIIFVQKPLVKARFDHFDFSSLIVWFVPIEITFWFFRQRTQAMRRITIVKQRSTTVVTMDQGNLKELMKEALADSEGNCLILDIARNEFWVECVLFWNTVHVWHCCTSIEYKQIFAEHIVKVYLDQGAVSEVNVSAKTRKEIISKVQASSKDISLLDDSLFAPAIQETESLILTHVSHHLLNRVEFHKVLSRARTKKDEGVEKKV